MLLTLAEHDLFAPQHCIRSYVFPYLASGDKFTNIFLWQIWSWTQLKRNCRSDLVCLLFYTAVKACSSLWLQLWRDIIATTPKLQCRAPPQTLTRALAAWCISAVTKQPRSGRRVTPGAHQNTLRRLTASQQLSAAYISLPSAQGAQARSQCCSLAVLLRAKKHQQQFWDNFRFCKSAGLALYNPSLQMTASNHPVLYFVKAIQNNCIVIKQQWITTWRSVLWAAYNKLPFSWDPATVFFREQKTRWLPNSTHRQGQQLCEGWSLPTILQDNVGLGLVLWSWWTAFYLLLHPTVPHFSIDPLPAAQSQSICIVLKTDGAQKPQVEHTNCRIQHKTLHRNESLFPITLKVICTY